MWGNIEELYSVFKKEKYFLELRDLIVPNYTRCGLPLLPVLLTGMWSWFMFII